MAFTLLKPYFYTYKNELIGKRHRPWLNRELGVLVSSIAMMLLLYFSVDLFLSRLREHPNYEPLMLVNLLLSFGKRIPAPANPWGGCTLEWMVPSPPPLHNFVDPPQVLDYPYDFNQALTPQAKP